MLRLTRIALRRPALTVAGTLILTLGFAFGLLRLRLDTDGAALYPTDNPAIEQSEKDRQRFNDPEYAILLVKGPSLENLKETHEALRRLPGVRAGGIRSLANLADLRVEPDSLDARPFLDEIPEETGELIRRIGEHPFANGLLLSPDGDTAAFYIPAAVSEDRREVLATLRGFVESRRNAGFDMRLTGPLVAEASLGDMVLADLSSLIPVMVGVITLLLWWQLRTLGGLIVPMVEVGVVLIWTLGAMGFAGVPVTLVTTLLPVVLMALAITDEIHVLERVQNKLALGDSDVKAAVLSAMDELEPPILAASLTTAFGFFAFPFTSIEPLRQFGLFSTMGFVLSMVVSFTTIPALIVLLPAQFFLPSRARREKSERLVFFERWAIEAPRTGFILGCVLLLLAIPGLFRLTVGDNWTANFDPESELVAAERDFNRELWGTYRFDIVLEGRPEQFQKPAGIALLEEVVYRAGSAPGVAGTLSFLDPAGVVAAGYGDEGRLSSLPEDRAADYLALAGVSEDPMGLSNYLTPDGSTARVQLFLKGEDYRRDRALEAELRTRLEPVLRGVDWHFSGDIPTGLEMVRSIVTNQLRSIGFTFLAIALLVAFTQRPLVKAALVVMFPVLAGTTLVFGAMGYLGVPLGVATSMFGSLALGIGVDFGIHFVHGYRQEGSLVAMMGKAGKAMRWSSAVLALGFLVLALSSVRPNHSLGLLLAGSIVAAYGMTLLLLPALVGRLAE